MDNYDLCIETQLLCPFSVSVLVRRTCIQFHDVLFIELINNFQW